MSSSEESDAEFGFADSDDEVWQPEEVSESSGSSDTDMEPPDRPSTSKRWVDLIFSGQGYFYYTTIISAFL